MKEKFGKEKVSADKQMHAKSSVKPGKGSSITWACMTVVVTGCWCLLMMWVLMVMAGYIFKAHRSMLTALRTAIPKGQQFKVTWHKLREQPRIFSVQETGYSWVAPSWFQHSGAYFSGAVGRSEGKKTYKQAASEGGSSEALRKETQHCISSMGSGSQAAVKCKGCIANVLLNSHELTSSLGEKWLHESLGWNVEIVLTFDAEDRVMFICGASSPDKHKMPLIVRQSCVAVSLLCRTNSMSVY